MTVVVGTLALCADLSLKYLVDAEVQRAADAGAIAGAQRLLGDETVPTPGAALVVAEAQQTSAKNESTGGAMVVQPGDVQLGWWDEAARTFSPEALVDDSNAVRVTVGRSKARGNGIVTSIAPMVGIRELSSTRSAIARLAKVPDYSLIGAESFSAKGLLDVSSTDGSDNANIASNGPVTLNILGLVGITCIDGHIATQGVVSAPLIGMMTKIHRGIERPKHPFVLPPISTARVEAVNDNAQLGSAINGAGDLVVAGIVDVYAGTYCVNNVTVLAGTLVRVHGPVALYAKGSVTVLGSLLCPNNDASKLKVRVQGPGTVTVAANLNLTADIYAPASNIVMAAGVIYRGRLIGKRIDVLGTGIFILDPELDQPEIGTEHAILVR